MATICLAVRCQASLTKNVKKAVAFATGLPALVAASPAFALVRPGSKEWLSVHNDYNA